jgi:CRISPR-associated endonuclease/helicase Cas3
MRPLIWAKRSKDSDSAVKVTFHLLILHMIDVAWVTKALWNRVLGTDLQDSLSRVIGLNKEGTGKWLSFWAGLHDLGKANPGFQGNWEQARISLQKAGFRFPSLSVAPPTDLSLRQPSRIF